MKLYITVALRDKRKNERKNDGADNLKPQPRQLDQAQSHESASGACAFRMHSKMRPTTNKTSRVDFGSWGMSWRGSMPRSTRALEIPTTSYDSRSASAVCSPMIPSMHARISSSSARPVKVDELFGPGTRGARLGKEVLLDSLGSNATSVMFHVHHPKGMLKSCQSFLPCGDGTFPAI
jgi:hypothetical protein